MSTRPSSGNGAAGALIVILLWTYYSEQIFLFGSEVTKAIADVRSKPMASEARRIDNPSEVARSRSL
jgi:Ribonuclease BN-like family.